MTRTGATMGTPAYMAPEQVRDSSNVDARADVFSLGAILYELITGKNCFVGKNVMEIWEKICSGSYRPVADHSVDVPARMIRAIEQALVVDPEERLQTVSDLYACWCTDEAGEHVAVPGRQSLYFWPDTLRSGASAMAPTWDEDDESVGMERQGDSSTMVFVADQTTDWGGDNNASPPTLAPPSSGSIPPPDPPPKAKPLMWFVLAAAAVGVMGLWAQQQDSDSASTTAANNQHTSATDGAQKSTGQQGESTAGSDSDRVDEPTSNEAAENSEDHPTPQHVYPGLKDSIFQLNETAQKSDQQTLAVAQEALLRGNYPLAERHLNALVKL